MVLIAISSLAPTAHALTCDDGQEAKWYAGSAVNDLFSSADAACEAFDLATVGYPDHFFVYSELQPNLLNYKCYHITEFAQNLGSPPINFINTSLRCGDSGKNLGCGHTNNPCNVATGNKYRSETDFLSDSLGLTRSYNSLDLSNIGFGNGWRSNHHKAISISNESVTKVSWTGRSESFRNNRGEWVGDSDSGYLLTESADSFTFHMPDDSKEVYNRNGILMSEIDTNGQVKRYSYDSTTRKLSEVINHYGHSIKFDYVGGKVNKITDSNGISYLYEYDVNDNLIAVVFPDNTPDNGADNPRKLYHYDDPAFPNHLTGITDENGERHQTYQYDEQGRAISSEKSATSGPKGQERIELDFQ